jgi:hypothetical protein
LDNPAPPPARPAIPFAGLRLVFALINGVLWFTLVFAICSGISIGVVAAGRFTRGAAVVFAKAVAFFVPFFGLSGAISGFLEQAQSGRFLLPEPVNDANGEAEPREGVLDSIWLHGAGIGLVMALVVAAFGHYYLRGDGVPDRGAVCLALAGMAAGIATLQSALLVSKKTLRDLEAPAGTPAPPSRSYYLIRFALPQGVGNGLITALAAYGTFPTLAGPPTPVDVAIASMGNALVIAFFMVLSAGDLAGTDHRFGRIGTVDAAPPSRLARAGIVVLAGLAAGIAGYLLALPAGAKGLSLPIVVAWQGALGAVVGGLLAARAARWRLSVRAAEPRSAGASPPGPKSE